MVNSGTPSNLRFKRLLLKLSGEALLGKGSHGIDMNEVAACENTDRCGAAAHIDQSRAHLGLVIDERLSEPASIVMTVRNAAGDAVLTAKDPQPQGDGRVSWDGRNEAGNVVRDGDFEIELTPRDAAGNVGRSETVKVRVLTALTKVRSSATGLSIRDRDKLGNDVTLATRLLAPATVTWRITRAGGKPVATRFDDRRLKEGRITWRWNGRDERGRVVPDGDYVATIAAATPDGVLRYQVPLHVGALDINASTREPRRGTRMRIIATSAERLRGKVTVEVEIGRAHV